MLLSDTDDPEKAISEAINILKKILEHPDTPKNVRDIIIRALEILQRTDREPHMRASAAIDVLNEITEKQNISNKKHLRFYIRQVIAILESINPK